MSTKQGGRTCRSFTQARRRPTEMGKIPGLTLPWTFTLPQVAIGVGALMLAWSWSGQALADGCWCHCWRGRPSSGTPSAGSR